MTHKQRVLALLADGKPHSHHELYALGCVAHSRISDLRRDGHTIEQWRDGDDYLYRLVASAEPAPIHRQSAAPKPSPIDAALSPDGGPNIGPGSADAHEQLSLIGAAA